jgi:ABC-type antimicrobial peptide transport system permease subunit
VTTLEDAVGASLARDRFTATILGVFAMVAIILAMVGIYGVFAADVSARRQEIGLRMALGASPATILGLLVARGATLALAGAVIGVAGGIAVSRSMSALVFGLQTSDPGSFASVAGLLVGVALAATLVPAIRAAKVDPMEALRSN